jgi:hypothetical protein
VRHASASQRALQDGARASRWPIRSRNGMRQPGDFAGIEAGEV